MPLSKNPLNVLLIVPKPPTSSPGYVWICRFPSTTLFSRQLRFAFCLTRYLAGNLQPAELPLAGDGDSRQTQFNVRGGVCLAFLAFCKVSRDLITSLLDEPATVASWIS